MTDSLDTLKPDPRNARKHSQDNLDLISSELRKSSAARSIVVDNVREATPSVHAVSEARSESHHQLLR